MINLEKSFNIHDYIELVLRRVWYVIIPFVVVATGACLYAFSVPKEYQATTLILVTPQKIPETFVRSTVTSKIEDRLQSIAQEILSRTRLEQVISELKLYQEESKTSPMERIVELMRKKIKVEIRGKDGYFTISYMGRDARLITTVTNKLASLFIEENLKLREQQAQGTTEFLALELNATKAKLDENEKVVSQFKSQFLYELPDQRDTSLNILGKLQQQLQTIGDTLKSAQDRKLIIQKQLTEMRNMAALLNQQEGLVEEKALPSNPAALLSPSIPQSPKPKMKRSEESQIEQFKNHLSELEIKYTEKHPDIISTKKRIAELEKKVEKASEKEAEDMKETETPSSGVAAPGASKGKKKGDKMDEGMDPFYKEMEGQLAATDLEINRLKEEQAAVKAKIHEYQRRIENIPVREMAMANLTRDYQNTKETYGTLLKKSQEAQQSENLERRQKGEQFRVIDPARIPEKPINPDIPKILLLGIVLGMGAGLGVAFFREQLDRSFRDAEDLEATLGFKVLANIPKVNIRAV